MQLQDIQALVSKLKADDRFHVETTTLGRFLGDKSNQISDALGKDILSKPVLVSTSADSIQILDLKTGFVVSVSNLEELTEKVIERFREEEVEVPQPIRDNSQDVISTTYDMLITHKVDNGGFHKHLCKINDAISQSAPTEKKAQLIQKTISMLDCRMQEADEVEKKRIIRAQEKLGNLVRHCKSKALAPGQISAVYEIAVWNWLKS